MVMYRRGNMPAHNIIHDTRPAFSITTRRIYMRMHGAWCHDNEIKKKITKQNENDIACIVTLAKVNW
jgi:hypothetical protein